MNLDFVGTTFSLLATFFSVKMNPLTWPASLIAILINATLYWKIELYGQWILELLYIISTLYGWYLWKFNKAKPEKTVSNISKNQVAIMALIAPFGIVVLSFLLHLKTKSALSIIDANIVIFSLMAQWMLVHKVIECWLMWFIVDLLVCVLHWFKDLPFHSVQHFIYLGFAIAGYLHWRKIQESQRKHDKKASTQTSQSMSNAAISVTL